MNTDEVLTRCLTFGVSQLVASNFAITLKLLASSDKYNILSI